MSEFEILFDATFPWSDTVNDTFPGIQDLVDVRYAEAALWEPGEYYIRLARFGQKEQQQTMSKHVSDM